MPLRDHTNNSIRDEHFGTCVCICVCTYRYSNPVCVCERRRECGCYGLIKAYYGKTEAEMLVTIKSALKDFENLHGIPKRYSNRCVTLMFSYLGEE